MKKFTVRLDNVDEKRLDSIKDFYNSRADFAGILTVSYNDVIQLALRCLAEDLDLEDNSVV